MEIKYKRSKLEFRWALEWRPTLNLEGFGPISNSPFFSLSLPLSLSHSLILSFSLPLTLSYFLSFFCSISISLLSNSLSLFHLLSLSLPIFHSLSFYVFPLSLALSLALPLALSLSSHPKIKFHSNWDHFLVIHSFRF